MLPYIKDPNRSAEDRTVYWQHENHSAVRDGDWKLVTVNDRSNQRWELYNLRNDRSETQNVAAIELNKVALLKSKWSSWAERVQAIPFPEQRLDETSANPKTP